MSALQPEGVPFELLGRTWHLKWTLAAIDKAQERFDEPIGAIALRLVDDRQLPKAVANLLQILIADEIDRDMLGIEPPTVKEIMWAIDIRNLGAAADALIKSYGFDMPEDDGEDQKN